MKTREQEYEELYGELMRDMTAKENHRARLPGSPVIPTERGGRAPIVANDYLCKAILRVATEPMLAPRIADLAGDLLSEVVMAQRVRDRLTGVLTKAGLVREAHRNGKHTYWIRVEKGAG